MISEEIEKSSFFVEIILVCIDEELPCRQDIHKEKFMDMHQIIQIYENNK